jgi:signal transduction histidine kinase
VVRSSSSPIDPASVPLAVSPFRSNTRRLQWPLVVLLLSIGLTAVAAFDAQRVVHNQRKVADRALREYASFAAWSYAQHLAAALDGVGREVLGAVNHGDNMHTAPRIPTARDLAAYLPWDETCGCRRTFAGPSPTAFFAMDLGTRTVSQDHNLAPDSLEFGQVYRSVADATEGNAANVARPSRGTFEQWLIDSLSARVRSRSGMTRGFRFAVERQTISPRVVAYTLMPTIWRDTIVYGAVYSPSAFSRMLAGALDSPGLLPDAFAEGRRNRDVISVAVADRGGHRLFTTEVPPATDLSARVSTAFSADSLVVDAAVRPEVASTLLIGGLPATGVPFPLGLLALAAALSVIAVIQLRREGELARLRAGFVSSVSHELRTPVAQIRLYLETLRLGRADTPAQREWALGHIDRESRRLAYLVENVLRFSTLEQAQALLAEPIDLVTATREVIAEFEPLAQSRGVSIELRARPTPMVALRADAFRHILMNLLDNAVKYGPSEQTIRVSVSPANDRVTVSVEDEGPRVPAAERDDIWRAFARGSTSTASGGSGIGLTIVRELAQAHGGTATLDGGGTGGNRFILSFPVAGGVHRDGL